LLAVRGGKFKSMEKWTSITDGYPAENDADDRGYVLVYLRKDRQWGWPTRVGFGKWNRVCKGSHTHWMQPPKPPIDSNETIEDGFGGVWSIVCPECNNKTMQIMRPGKVQCSKCG